MRVCSCAQAAYTAELTPAERTAAQPYARPHAHGVQFHAEPLPGEVVGQPVQHMAADLQVGVPLVCCY